MIECELTITLNRPNDLANIETILRAQKIQSPIFIVRFEDDILIKFTSDYEHSELNREIENGFKGYEFTNDVGNGKKEVRIKIHRYQSPFSTDDWGRSIENPLDETVYLIKPHAAKEPKFNREIKVLFEEEAKYYYINIVPGIAKTTQEKGYLLEDSFEDLREKEVPFIPKLYSKFSDAYWAGYSKLEDHAKQDFSDFQKEKKKQNRKRKK